MPSRKIKSIKTEAGHPHREHRSKGGRKKRRLHDINDIRKKRLSEKLREDEVRMAKKELSTLKNATLKA